MTVRRTNDGRGSRDLLGLVEHAAQRTVPRRLKDLESASTAFTGGVIGGGDPNAGFPPVLPLIVNAVPSMAWHDGTWHLRITLTLAYDPPPNIEWLEAEVAGDDGFDAVVELHAPFTAPAPATWVIEDIGLALGKHYQVAVRAKLSDRYTNWTQPFTGIYFDTSILFPSAPTNVRIDTSYNGGLGHGWNDRGGKFGLLWDQADPQPDEWHIDFWPVDDPTEVRHWIWPQSRGIGVVVETLDRGRAFHVEIAAVRGGYTSLFTALPGGITIPTETPPPPTGLALNTTALPPDGWGWQEPRGSAKIAYQHDPLAYPPPDWAAGKFHLQIFRTDVTPHERVIDWYYPISFSGTGLLVDQNLFVGIPYELYLSVVSQFGDLWEGAPAGPLPFTVPAEDPPPPTGLSASVEFTVQGPKLTVSFTHPVGYSAGHFGIIVEDTALHNIYHYSETIDPTATSTTFFGDLPFLRDHTYDITMYSLSPSGNPGTRTTTLSAYNIGHETPAASDPTGQGSVNGSSGSIRLLWPDNPPWTLAQNEFEIRPHGLGVWGPAGTEPANHFLHTILGLTPGRAYDVRRNGRSADGLYLVVGNTVGPITIPKAPAPTLTGDSPPDSDFGLWTPADPAAVVLDTTVADLGTAQTWAIAVDPAAGTLPAMVSDGFAAVPGDDHSVRLRYVSDGATPDVGIAMTVDWYADPTDPDLGVPPVATDVLNGAAPTTSPQEMKGQMKVPTGVKYGVATLLFAAGALLSQVNVSVLTPVNKAAQAADIGRSAVGAGQRIAGPVSAPGLVENWSFEDPDPQDPTLPDGFTRSHTDANNTVIRSSGESKHGAYKVRITTDGDNRPAITSGFIPITLDEIYDIGIWAKGSRGGSAYSMTIRYYDADKVQIGSDDVVALPLSTSYTFHYVERGFSSDDGTRFVTLEWGVTLDGAPSQYADFDAIQFSNGPTAADGTPGLTADFVVDGRYLDFQNGLLVAMIPDAVLDGSDTVIDGGSVVTGP